MMESPRPIGLANEPGAAVLGGGYGRVVKDYISELEIVRNGNVVAAKNVEVNHPLHYGDYHFFQQSCGEDDPLGEYTVLMVVSDSGLYLVYSGYALLVAGVFWHFWGRRLLAAIPTRRIAAPTALAPHG
jgi:hypothetical protein